MAAQRMNVVAPSGSLDGDAPPDGVIALRTVARTLDGTSRVDPAAAHVIEQALQASRRAFEE